MNYEIITHSHIETLELGECLSNFLTKEDVVLLEGNLGAGKTCLVKGIGKGLNIKEIITSPTFNIIRCYFNDILNLYHIDAYRLEDSKSDDIGLEEYLYGDGVCVIEWSEYISYLLPAHSLKISFEIIDLNTRKITFSSDSKHYDEIIEKVINYGK